MLTIIDTVSNFTCKRRTENLEKRRIKEDSIIEKIKVEKREEKRGKTKVRRKSGVPNEKFPSPTAIETFSNFTWKPPTTACR